MRCRVFAAAVAVWAAFFVSARAGDPQLVKAPAAAPAEVAPAVREALAAEAFQVLSDGKTLAEFWFRREVPAQEGQSPGLGVSFGQLEESTFVGVARFPAGWADYKGKPVPPGTYTLRYEVQPADGSHIGVSLYRDFLLLIPAAADADPQAVYGYHDLVALSKKASGTPHPAVLSLFPVEEELASPALAKNVLDQWTVQVKLGSVKLGLVVIGKGEVEG